MFSLPLGLPPSFRYRGLRLAVDLLWLERKSAYSGRSDRGDGTKKSYYFAP